MVTSCEMRLNKKRTKTNGTYAQMGLKMNEADRVNKGVGGRVSEGEGKEKGVEYEFI